MLHNWSVGIFQNKLHYLEIKTHLKQLYKRLLAKGEILRNTLKVTMTIKILYIILYLENSFF